MKNYLLFALVAFGLYTVPACTSAQVAADVHEGIAWVKSGALMVKGAFAAVRSNSTSIEDALSIAKAAFPPGSDLSQLDDEAQSLVMVIQTSTDQQLVEQAAEKLIAKMRAK